MTYKGSRVCQLPGLSCVGCCGRDFGTRAELTEAIRKNTQQYRRYKNKRKFMERTRFLRDCGICANVIFFEDGRVGCPLHPELNGKDIREGHCDTDHLCIAARRFPAWSRKKQRDFIEFVKGRKMDWYQYSLLMDSDKLVEEFEARSANKSQ
jgi:hypothetical protein